MKGRIYKRRNFMYILIPSVGLFVALIFIIVTPNMDLNVAIINLFGSVVLTAAIWLGSQEIVHYLWLKFPWETHPKKHLVLEVICMIIYPAFVVSVLTAVYISLTNDWKWINDAKGTMFTAIIITLLITSIHEGVYFFKRWRLNQLEAEQLQRANLQAKYETLKHQVNPHFLFNSLNTLLSLTEDNPRASEFTEKLSDFLRYLLKHRDQEIVLLREELSLTEKYVYLQKVRFQSSLTVEIQVDEKYFHYSVPPLSVQMLVENAIKHNSKSKENPLEIRVFVDENRMLVVENNLQRIADSESTGIGLENINNRYLFLTTEKVKIEENKLHFRVSLPLLLID